MPYQNVVLSTITLTVPGSLQFLVKVSSISIASSSSSLLSSESISSASQSSRSQGEPVDLKIPDAAAWVSVGELKAAAGVLRPRELRAMRIWDGLVLIPSCVKWTAINCLQFPLRGESEIPATLQSDFELAEGQSDL